MYKNEIYLLNSVIEDKVLIIVRYYLKSKKTAQAKKG